MIVVDLETSGLHPERNGIWQIGAIDVDNPSNTFIEESKIDEDDVADPDALEFLEKTEGELRDGNKQTQKQMLEKFFEWCKKIKGRNLICQNPQFDVGFLTIKARKHGLDVPFPHRSFDLHSIASSAYHKLNGKFYFEEREGELNSGMNLSKILEFCGMKDKRKISYKGKTIQEGNPHNALEDSKLTGECFSRIVYGKPLLDEYSQYEMPEELRK
jgi:DNA polymerase III epsilon subunit-like protein